MQQNWRVKLAPPLVLLHIHLRGVVVPHQEPHRRQTNGDMTKSWNAMKCCASLVLQENYLSLQLDDLSVILHGLLVALQFEHARVFFYDTAH